MCDRFGEWVYLCDVGKVRENSTFHFSVHPVDSRNVSAPRSGNYFSNFFFSFFFLYLFSPFHSPFFALSTLLTSCSCFPCVLSFVSTAENRLETPKKWTQVFRVTGLVHLCFILLFESVSVCGFRVPNPCIDFWTGYEKLKREKEPEREKESVTAAVRLRKIVDLLVVLSLDARIKLFERVCVKWKENVGSIQKEDF